MKLKEIINEGAATTLDRDLGIGYEVTPNGLRLFNSGNEVTFPKEKLQSIVSGNDEWEYEKDGSIESNGHFTAPIASISSDEVSFFVDGRVVAQILNQ